jgi:hypothetical protein
MQELTELFHFIQSLDSVGWLVLFVIGIHHTYAISSFIHERRKRTISKVMSFVETILNDINYESMKNVKSLNVDPKDIPAYSTALQLALFVGIRYNCKTYLEENGYYDLYTNKENNRDKIEKLLTLRGTQLRNIAIPYIEAVLDENSVLLNKHEERFSTNQAIELFRTIVSRHVSEIQSEESDINDYIKTLFPFFIYKILPKYTHKSRMSLI